MKTMCPRKRYGRRLARLRAKAGLTQVDVSKQLSYTSGQYVSNWERGISYPPDDAIPVLAKALRTSHRELIKITFAARHAELYVEQVQALRGAKHDT